MKALLAKRKSLVSIFAGFQKTIDELDAFVAASEDRDAAIEDEIAELEVESTALRIEATQAVGAIGQLQKIIGGAESE